MNPSLSRNNPALVRLLLSSCDHLHDHLLVERGYALHLEITKLTEELQFIQKQLGKRAAACPLSWRPLAFDQGGKEWVALGRGCEFHLLRPTPPLKSQIEATARQFSKIRELSAGAFSSLFRKITAIQIRHPETFRDQIATLFPQDKADRLIGLCSTHRKNEIIWTRYARSRTQRTLR